MLKVGAQAPDFTVVLGSGEEFTLSEHIGRNVVLFFFPRAFTHGCTAEVKSFSDHIQEFREGDAEVIGVSGDSIDRMKRFGEATGTQFGLGSDESAEVRRLYDVQRRFGLGTSRVTYVIDRRGTVRGVFHNELRMATHVRDALKTLDAIAQM